jgi:hypothetical protein
VWWFICIVPALERLRQEDGELEASLGHCNETLPQTLNQNKQTKKKKKKLNKGDKKDKGEGGGGEAN